MTTNNQNSWAQYLEDASQSEIRQMAEYAIDHIEDIKQLRELRKHLALSISPKVFDEKPD